MHLIDRVFNQKNPVISDSEFQELFGHMPRAEKEAAKRYAVSRIKKNTKPGFKRKALY